MQNHKKHDEADLIDALEHVVYEIWKYKQSIAHYGQIQTVGGDAAIEFRVLHHRVLLEFFYGPPKHADNIVAWEYVADWQQTHPRGSVWWLDNYMKRCHTMLAHISKTRSEIAKLGLKSWNDWRTVEVHLDQTITAFLAALAKDHQDVCFRWIDKWLVECRPWSDVLMELR
jgi:hypothetical protein